MAGSEDLYDAIHIPLVRTKRRHRKSRLGCVRCRERRIKCDEQHPSCLSCLKRNEQCVYRQPERAAAPNVATEDAGIDVTPPTTDSNSAGVNTPLDVDIDVDEAELLRIYFVHVVPSYSETNSRPEQHWIWQVFVPSVAYGSQTVRYGMITAAALYMHFAGLTSNEADAVNWLEVANAYGSTFVERSRQQLCRFDASETDSSIACARLLAGLALGFFRQYRQEGTTIDDPFAWRWLHLLLGVKTVHESLLTCGRTIHPQILQDMQPEVVFSDEQPWRNGQRSIEDSELGRNDLLLYLRKTLEERFTAMRAATFQRGLNPSVTAPMTSACIAATNRLEKVTQYVCTVQCYSLFRVLVTWMGGLSLDFVHMLEAGDPAALGIYAHWLMLMMLVEDLWWIGDMGRAGIRAIVECAYDETLATTKLLSWPRKALNICENHA